MWLNILIYVALIGAPVLAVYAIYRRIKNTDENTAGYVYNGKPWVAWLLLFCIIADFFIGFIMPLFDGMKGYHPEWGTLGLMLLAILLYLCYCIVAFVPATAEEIEEDKAEGKTVLGTLGSTTSTMFKAILAAIVTILAALPSMIKEALNPTLAVKSIGGTLYKVVGTGFGHAVGGVLAFVLIGALAFFVIYIASLVIAFIGTFFIGILAIVKFVMNNMDIFKKN